MKKNIKHVSRYLIIMLLATGFLATGVSAKEAIKPQTPSVDVASIVAATKHKILQAKKHDVTVEAVAVASETQKAIIALGNKNSKDATTILQGVSSKLDGILAKNPGLSLIPIEVEQDVFDFEGNSKSVARAIDETRALLNHGDIQAARQILAQMASEIRITTVNIPLGTFPDMIKQAIAQIQSEKNDLALVTLNDGLNTLEESVEIMPLPVLRAEELMTVAADLEHKDDLTQAKNRDDIQRYTDAAKDNLKVAELLGYGSKSDYKSLYKEIDSIDKVLFSEKSEAVWQKIKSRLSDLTSAVARIGYPTK